MDDVGNALFYGMTVEQYQYEAKYTKDEMVGEREELRAVEMKVVMPGKIVTYRCCPPSSNISMKKCSL